MSSAFLAALTKIEQAEAKATPGPWRCWENYSGGLFDTCRIAAPEYRQLIHCHAPEKIALPACRLIASSRNFLTAPRLAALRAAVEALRAIALDRSEVVALEALAGLEAAFTALDPRGVRRVCFDAVRADALLAELAEPLCRESSGAAQTETRTATPQPTNSGTARQ